VLNAFEDLVEVLHSADEDEGHECNLLWRSLHHRGQSAEPYEEAGIKFHAMQLFCAIVSMDMRLHVFLVLNKCFRRPDPQVYPLSEANAFKLSHYA